MSGPAVVSDLSDQFGAEHRAQERQFVLAVIATRWRLIPIGALLLAAALGLRVVDFPWSFLLAFAILSILANAGMSQLVRRTAFRPQYLTLTLLLGATMISAVVYVLTGSGYLLSPLYLIAPAAAALHLGRHSA